MKCPICSKELQLQKDSDGDLMVHKSYEDFLSCGVEK